MRLNCRIPCHVEDKPPNWLDTRIRGYAIKLRETQNMKHNSHFEPQTNETMRYTLTVLFAILYFIFTYSFALILQTCVIYFF